MRSICFLFFFICFFSNQLNAQSEYRLAFSDPKVLNESLSADTDFTGIPLNFNFADSKFVTPRNKIEGSELTIASSKSFSGIVYQFPAERQRKYQSATWKWKVIQSPKHNKKHVKHFDQAIQIVFVTDSNRTNFYRGLAYAWTAYSTGHEPRYWGEQKSFKKNINVNVIRKRYGTRDDSSKWYEETCELSSDFDKVAKIKDAKIIGVIIYGDTNHTKSKSKAVIKDIILK